MKLGYVSYTDDPNDSDPDLDIPILVPALVDEGFEVEIIDWQEETNLKQFDVLLIRSPWNYAQHYLEFVKWLQQANLQSHLINPVEIMLLNLDKRYLFDLAKAGIEIIPTNLISDPNQAVFPTSLSTIVLKPIVGAGARGAVVLSQKSQFESYVTTHFAQSNLPLLMQPYLTEVDEPGEIAVVCSYGNLLHAVVKRPALSAGGHGDFAANIEITKDLKDFVIKIMSIRIGSRLVSELAYSRVDVVPTGSGFKLMELELVEPTLFLHTNPKSAKIIAEAVRREFELSRR